MRIDFLRKPVVNMTKVDYATCLNNACVKCKELAMDLYEAGLKDNVTPSFVDRIAPEAFESQKGFSEETRTLLEGALEELGLSKNASVKKFINKVKNHEFDFDLSLDLPWLM